MTFPPAGPHSAPTLLPRMPPTATEFSPLKIVLGAGADAPLEPGLPVLGGDAVEALFPAAQPAGRAGALTLFRHEDWLVGGATVYGTLIPRLMKTVPPAFLMPWHVLLGTGLAVLVIVVLASLVSIRKVLVLEPATVFK